MTKRRVKISRPAGAAPNTAFTQVSQPGPHDSRAAKIRIAVDPSDLADDSYASVGSTEVQGQVIFVCVNLDQDGKVSQKQDYWLVPSCRSPQMLRVAYREVAGSWSNYGPDFLGFVPPKKTQKAE